jgi:cycloeucalenol cycloisomerase
MAMVLGGIAMFLVILKSFLVHKQGTESTWLPSKNSLAKRQYEVWCLQYSVVWISAMGVVIVTQAYEHFSEWDYMTLMIVLSSPLLLQPFLYPMDAEKTIPLCNRYSFKATVWIAIFSFIGNYWYTHYFYSVLKAEYLFPAHRLNDVPICLFLATHFYFVTYHTFANLILRKIETTFQNNRLRCVYFWSCTLGFSYFTAFMETLTISSFPYYRFEDRFMAYTLGSAFYGIYFIVSFPAYFSLDEDVGRVPGAKPYTLAQTAMEALGASMLVLCLLDFCRLALEVPLNISGRLYYLYRAPVAK